MSDILDAADPATRDQVVDGLRAGGLAVLPTDTVYGVVADAFAPTATRRLLRARGSGRNRPLTVLIRSARQVVGLAGDVPESADRLMAAYWPGPLTVVLRASPGMTWDLGNNAGTVALRIPTDDDLLAVIKEVGPLACSAASRRGGEPPTTAESARDQLGDAVACYVDGGERDAVVSTIVDASRGESVEVLRAGAVPAADIMHVAQGDLDWGARPDPTTPTEHATPTEQPDRAGQAEHGERAGPAEPAEQTDKAEPARPAEPAEPTERAGPAGPAEEE